MPDSHTRKRYQIEAQLRRNANRDPDKGTIENPLPMGPYKSPRNSQIVDNDDDS